MLPASDAAAASTAEKFGKIDILVANAGISGPDLKMLGISGGGLEADC